MRQTTKGKILAGHQANTLLQTPIIASVPDGPGDLRCDQPTAALPASALRGAIGALEQGQTHYVDVPGIMPLREAIASGLGADYRADAIVVTASVQEARLLTLQILGQSSGSLALPSVVHPGVRKALGVRPLVHRWLEVDDGARLLPSVEVVGAALASGAKCVFLESPSRLTGAVYSAAEVEHLGRLVVEHSALIVWDQGLSQWAATGASLGALGVGAERVTLIGEVFPGVGLEGLAIGFIATSGTHTADFTSLKQIIAICTSTASQYAALGVDEGYTARRDEIEGELRERRSRLLQWLESIGAQVLEGGAANLVAVRRTGTVATALRERGLAAAEGRAFGAPDVLRLAIPGEVPQ